MLKKNVTIVGSGISGLSLGKMLSPANNVRILEKSDTVGGLIKCDRIDGKLFHRVGGHVFNSKNSKVLDWFWDHFNQKEEFIATRRNAKIYFNGGFVGYPIENYLYQLPATITIPVIRELLKLSAQQPKEAREYDNFKDFLIGNFGLELYNLYFGPYNSKLWNTDLANVPLDWLDGKLPMPKITEIIISNIIKQEESTMVHANFFYPKNNGSQFIVDRFSENQNIHCAYPLKRLYIGSNGKIAINEETSAIDSLVYCGDVRKLADIISIQDEALTNALADVKTLLSNGTSNVLCETDETDISWLYIPEDRYLAHRIIYTGNFSVTNNGDGKRKTCVVEFSGQVEKDKIVRELAMLPGNLTPVAFNFEPNSYIIQAKDTRQKIDNLKKHLAPYNIHLLGRFAEWEYYNMDKCIESAMALSTLLS